MVVKKARPLLVALAFLAISVTKSSSSSLPAEDGQFFMFQKVGPRLRELAPGTRVSLEAVSHNLVFPFSVEERPIHLIFGFFCDPMEFCLFDAMCESNQWCDLSLQ